MDDYDDGGRSTCPECGKPMSSDTDGDGVMTMSYEFCEDCGTKDYGEPLRLTEQIIARMREEEGAAVGATGSASHPDHVPQVLDVPATTGSPPVAS